MKVVRFSALCIGWLYPKELFLVLIFVRSWVKPRAIVWPEGLCQWKITVIPLGIKPVTFWFLAQCLNHCSTACPQQKWVPGIFLGGKGGRCVGPTLPPSCDNCHDIWEPQLPGNLRACPRLYWDCLPNFQVITMRTDIAPNQPLDIALNQPLDIAPNQSPYIAPKKPLDIAPN
jgi:hypothetical protein